VKSHWRRYVAAGLLLALFSPARGEQLLALARGERNLYRIDTDALGAPVLVGNISVGTDLSELIVLAPDHLCTFDRYANTIITLSTADASVLSVTGLDRDISIHPRGFDLSPTGVLYGVFSNMELCTVDPATGTTTHVAWITGAPQVEALAFAPDGTLFAAGSTEDDVLSESLYLLDPSTGAMALIGSMGVGDVDCLSFGYDGFLYGADSLAGWSADLYRIRPDTGAATILGDAGVIELNGIAWIPEPAALALLMLGGSAVLRRKASQARR